MLLITFKGDIDVIDLLGKICIPLIIGWITFVIAKKNIVNVGVTQFRQQWIDELRSAISLFIAKAEMIFGNEIDGNENYDNHFAELVQMQYTIELMLNPAEPDHDAVVTKMDEIRVLIHEDDVNDALEQELDDKIIELLIITKQILKKEWNVVKRGK